jgi:hypothetical protein
MALPPEMARLEIATLPESTKNTRLVLPPLMVSPDEPEPSIVTFALIAGSGVAIVIVELAGRLKVMVDPGLAFANVRAARSEPVPESLPFVTTCARADVTTKRLAQISAKPAASAVTRRRSSPRTHDGN